MEELIKAVVAKTGLSESHARMAVEAVLSFLQTKLPAPLASQLHGLLAGGGSAVDLSSIGGALGGLGNLFEKK